VFPTDASWLGRARRQRPEWFGLVIGSPVLLLTVVLTIPAGIGAALGSLILFVAGLVVVAVLAPLSQVLSSPAPPARLNRWWRTPALTGLAVGLLPALAWTVTGGPGWGARLAALVGVGLWVASASLQASADPRAGRWVVPAAFLALVVITGLGYGTAAGLLFYLGQPLALVVLLAGQTASGGSGVVDAKPSLDLAGTGYAVAAVAMAFLAWVDLL